MSHAVALLLSRSVFAGLGFRYVRGVWISVGLLVGRSW